MMIRDLDKMFRPRSVAVIGASNTVGSVGYTVLNNLLTDGYKGAVYAINPKHPQVQGIAAHASISEVPKPVDLAVIATPAPTVPGVITQCGNAGVGAVIILSAGFGETGEDGRALEKQVAKAAQPFDRMRILGPNCLGILVPEIGLNASFASGLPREGNIAFVSQSGALCTSVLDWAIEQQIGFSHFLSIGNMLDVSFAHLIDWFGECPKTKSIVLYVESIKDARHFMSAARAFSRTKPIIAYKAGRFPQSAKATQSHTGALAGEDDVYDAAFQRAGIERVESLADMFDCAELLARHKPPRGERLAIVTNAGGPGVMACDALLARHGVLATLTSDTIEKLSALLPPCWSHGNPVDVLGDAPAERYRDALKLVLADAGVDAVLVILTPQAMTDPTAAAHAVTEAARTTSKPVLTSWMGAAAVREGMAVLDAAGLPTYSNPEQAINAFTHLVSYARKLKTLYETPREMPQLFGLQLRERRQGAQAILSSGGTVLSEVDAKRLLECYDIPVMVPVICTNADDAANHARQMGYPVVLKIHSPDITHKTDVGGVVLNLPDEAAVRAAFERITRQAREARPDANVEGVTVQKMFAAAHSMELILGCKRDPVMGTMILLGAGGIAAEVMRDRVLELPPLNERLARNMIESLRSWPLLRGYRGRPAVDIERLIEVLIQFSYMVADHPRIIECDINPLVAAPDALLALDARVVVGPPEPTCATNPYPHLAIRPYPEQYSRFATMKDGTAVQLRPIRPEDEPMWHDLLDSCSPETIRARFFSLIGTFPHEMATRYCCIDYDREMAIVAELQVGQQRKILGVGRLVAEPGHGSAEYAVLVTDAWQGKGLGLLLTDYCLEIARTWGVREVTAVTAPENRRMIATFTEYGFEVKRDTEEGTVVARKVL